MKILLLLLSCLSCCAQFASYSDLPFLSALPSTASFAFTNVSGLSLWLDADHMTNVTHQPIQDGDVVSGGVDQSPSNHTVAAYGTTVPKYRTTGGGTNGTYPYLAATNGGGIGTSQSLFTSTSFTVVMVIRFTTASAGLGAGTYLLGMANSGNPQLIYDINQSSTSAGVMSTTNAIQMQNGGPLLVSPGNSITTNVWYVATFLYNGTSSQMRTNGAVLKAGSAGTTAGVTGQIRTYGLFSFANSSGFGDLMRLMLWSRALTTNEFLQVETKCRSDFGI